MLSFTIRNRIENNKCSFNCLKCKHEDISRSILRMPRMPLIVIGSCVGCSCDVSETSYMQLARMLCVESRDANSLLLSLGCGVPQGSILGPLCKYSPTTSPAMFIYHIPVWYLIIYSVMKLDKILRPKSGIFKIGKISKL
jgi:hypothetical protein